MIDKKKYVITLFAVLLIGFVLGFLINGRLTRAHITKMQNYFTEQGFNRALVRIIKPTPEQMKQISPILRKYARKNRQRMMDMRKAQKNSMDSLEMELKQLLTREQINRLEMFKKRREKRYMHFHRQEKFKNRKKFR